MSIGSADEMRFDIHFCSIGQLWDTLFSGSLTRKSDGLFLTSYTGESAQKGRPEAQKNSFSTEVSQKSWKGQQDNRVGAPRLRSACEFTSGFRLSKSILLRSRN